LWQQLFAGRGNNSIFIALKPTAYILLLGMALMLCACPYRSVHALEAGPSQPLDSNLLGKWAAFVKKNNSEKEEPVKLIISAQADNVYAFAITGYIDELKPHRLFTGDSIKGTAFVVMLANRSFLNITIKEYQYMAELQWHKGKPSVLPIAENFTNKLIKNSQELRTALEYHCKVRFQPTYDEAFCLRHMVRVN
jgi:hypothetical protein